MKKKPVTFPFVVWTAAACDFPSLFAKRRVSDRATQPAQLRTRRPHRERF